MMAFDSVQPLPKQFLIPPSRIHVSDVEVEDLLVQAQPELDDPAREVELSCLKVDMKIILRKALAGYIQGENLRRHSDLLTLGQRITTHQYVSDRYQDALLAAGDAGPLRSGLELFLANIQAAE